MDKLKERGKSTEMPVKTPYTFFKHYMFNINRANINTNFIRQTHEEIHFIEPITRIQNLYTTERNRDVIITV